jgi:uncharacterized protein YjbI with pentapeptide repeats
MKLKIDIYEILTNRLLFTHEVENNNMLITLMEGLRSGADLHSADLRGADLRGADLHGVNLNMAIVANKSLFENTWFQL